MKHVALFLTVVVWIAVSVAIVNLAVMYFPSVFR